MSPEEQIRRGEIAKSLLEHDLMKEAFATVKATLLVEWDASTTKDTDLRERLWMQLQMLNRVHAHLEGVMVGGELKRRELAQIEQDRKFNAWRRAV